MYSARIILGKSREGVGCGNSLPPVGCGDLQPRKPAALSGVAAVERLSPACVSKSHGWQSCSAGRAIEKSLGAHADRRRCRQSRSTRGSPGASWGINAIDPHKAQGLSREYPSRVGVPSLWLQQSPEPLWIDDQHPAILKGCDGSSGLNGTWRRLPPMPNPQSDTRSESRKVRDEELAAAPMLPIPAPSPGDAPQPLEAYLPPRRPVAVLGIVENGVVRLLGEGVSIPEHSRVIVVASDAG